MTIFRPDENAQGLFGFTHGGEVINVQLVHMVVCGHSMVGGLIAVTQAVTNIEHCSVHGNVLGEAEQIGGLVGSSYANWFITNCHADVRVTGLSNAGGLVGFLGMSSEIRMSYSTGTINVLQHGVGGLVGLCDDSSVINCYSRASVYGLSRAGGLLGDCSGVELNDSYSTGDVHGSGSDIGGLIGYYNGSPAFGDCYWDTDTSGMTISDGGYGRTTSEMTLPNWDNTFVGWDFDTVWSDDIEGTINDGYPYLTQNHITGTGEETLAVPGFNLSNSPNPFSIKTDISFQLPKATLATVTIYNLKGQKVHRWAGSSYSQGENKVSWDGKTEDGKTVPNGVYLCRVRCGGDSAVRKLTLLK